MKSTDSKTAALPAVFARLRSVLQRHAGELEVVRDKPDDYYLNTRIPRAQSKKKEPTFFAAAQIKKNYVSLHLLPVYVFPALLDDLSPALRKRLTGKGCFNFTAVDDALFRELGELIARGFDTFRREGLA